MASGDRKVAPIVAVLRGGAAGELVTDDQTAKAVVGTHGGERRCSLSARSGKSGIKASAVGLGTWAMGGWMWGGGDDDASVTAIRASLDAGVTLIDTAPAYGLGRAEEVVGRAIAGRRDEVVLVTKCGLVWDNPGGRPFVEQDGKTIHRYLGAQSVRAELEASLKRLRTDHVDVLITHWQDPTTPIAETMDALLALKKEGKCRAIGISNASVDDLDAYIAAGQVDCVQEAYNMLDRGLEKTLLPVCRREGISVISYSSLALGLLTGTDRSGAGVHRRRSQAQQSALLRREPQAGGRLRLRAGADRATPWRARLARW